MTLNLDILRLSQSLTSHASDRQAMIARNVANADTPGYKASDLKPFSEIAAEGMSDPFTLKASRPQHLASLPSVGSATSHEVLVKGAESPNGNTVSLEDQMTRAMDVKAQHDLALGVYSKSLSILRMGLGRSG